METFNVCLEDGRTWKLEYSHDLLTDIEVYRPVPGGGHRFERIPWRVILALLAHCVRKRGIAKLERMSDVELLGLKD